MQKLFVIDASGWIYRSYFAIRNMTNAKGESTNALFGFIRTLQKLFKDFHPEHVVAVFDGPHNAKKREAIYPEYKAHRSAMPQDLLYQIERARTACELSGIPYLCIPEVEADDTMGCIAKWAEQLNATTYLCTSDKDMAQVVSDKIFLLNTHKENLILGRAEVEATYGVPPEKVIDLLSMVGDSSDNIPGLPGFGPKTAVALLQEFGSLDYLLAHPEVVSGKKREILTNEREKALLSRQLVTLDMSVEFPKDVNFYTIKPHDATKLKEFYTSMNFSSLLRELEETGLLDSSKVPKQEIEDLSYQTVDDEASFHELLTFLKGQKEICFDIQASAQNPIGAELVGIGFGTEPRKAWYIPANGALGIQRLLEGIKPLFENKKIAFYGHNVKYDLQILANYGIQMATLSFDTILASYLLNSHSRQHTLDHLALHHFGKVKMPLSELLGKGKSTLLISEAPLHLITLYCSEEIDYTIRLKLLLEKELKERKLTDLLHNLELPLLKVLAKMERAGIYLDIPFLKENGNQVAALIKGLEEEIYHLAGKPFNINSPKQLSEILFTDLGIKAPKKTATGLSTNVDVLESLQKDYPIAEKLLEYRTLEKLRSTYIESLPENVNPQTHRIHSTFNQSVAATGRLSSQDPNLQNIPVRSEAGRKIREAFRPEHQGWSYLAADYSQIELRLLAHLSEDPHLIQAFLNKEDIHAYTASLIFNVPLKEVTKEQRFQAKAVNFGIVYGQSPYGLSQELGIDPKEAAIFIEMYFKRYSRVREYLEECKEKARKTGRAVTYTGRERLIPEINSKNGQIRIAAERLAINTPLQGTAADLIKMAMLRVDERMQKEQMQGFMILQIHDELIFELPDFETMTFEPTVKEIMETIFKLKVPLVVDITIGKNWKEC